jgi:hypothetical protein
MNLIQQLLYSGGGFIAGVIATLTYAKTTDQKLKFPWN